MTKTDDLVKEFEEVVHKLKCRIIYMESENKKLKKIIAELKEFVRNK